MFDTVLIANRGEIAVRIARTLGRLGLESIAVHSDADAGARHVRAADRAVRLGPAPARESYLSVDRLIEAARRAGAQAVHPGYGFLSENAAFAEACEAAGLVFIGPSPGAIRVMGDKISAKRTVAAAGVPVLDGRNEPGLTDDDLVRAADEIGYPVLVKPSAGGGGKGMHVVASSAALREALTGARREAAASFGDDTLFVERFLPRPRHIEVQVLASAHGEVVHLGERECSLQRRHQKVVEEAPSVLLSPETRARIGAAACETARSVGYLGVGTVEFLVSDAAPDDFFFLEMNTRLQVEHPVTELVTGLDLVEQQLRVAAGEPLGFTQEDVALTGHAVEVRVYAEDPARGFLPSTGTVLALHEPSGEGVRVDSGIRTGDSVGTHYDPMLSKVIAHGPDRPAALRRLEKALARTTILGLRTNLGFLAALLADPEVRAGRIDTEFIDRSLDALVGSPPAPLEVYGLLRLLLLESASQDPWDVLSGWRIGEHRPLTLRVDDAEIRVHGTPAAAAVTVDPLTPPRPASIQRSAPDEVLVTIDGDTSRWHYALEPDGAVWLSDGRGTHRLSPAAQVTRARSQEAHGDELKSPMPGVVVAVNVKPGDPVTTGQPLVVIEAMKMEHTVAALHDGTVAEVLVAPGDQVALDQPLATTA
jgi:3-methylcrotonyl-CoA carboxylase alpha subunit